MKTIQAAKFKAQCLSLLDNVAQTHETLVVTKHGKPVAKILPFDSEKDVSATPLKGMATYIGDIISPLDDEWEVNR